MAVEVAVGIAVGEVAQGHEQPGNNTPPIRKVTVFSDSQQSLMGLRHPALPTGQKRPIERHAEKLREQGVELELRWVPGHLGICGNERADRLARLASVYAPAPESKGGMVRVSVLLLRVCERQVETIEALCRPSDPEVWKLFLNVWRRELKEALRTTGIHEGWLSGAWGGGVS